MTAPESTPDASTARAKAIAREIKAAFIEAYSDAAYSYSECPKGDLEDRAEDAWQKSESKKIADHAAIQRGGGKD